MFQFGHPGSGVCASFFLIDRSQRERIFSPFSGWWARRGFLWASREAGAGQIVRMARLAHELAGHKVEIDRMREEMDRKAEELAFYVDVGRALTSTPDLNATV